jgi:hypothetical protein
VTTINAYSATTLWKQKYTSPLYLSGTPHMVVIKNISPSGKYIDVDAIQIIAPPGPGTNIYDDDKSLWTYTGAWKTYSGAGPLNNTRHYTSTPDAKAEFSFTGSSTVPANFILTYTTSPTSGSFEVYVDNVLVTTVNAYSATTLWQQKYTSPVYSENKIYTVTIKHDGPNNSYSGTYIDVDAIQIAPTTP